METANLSTVSEPSHKPGYDISRLTGKLVKLWPYSRGLYPRDILYRVWAAMEQDNAAHLVFHGQQVPSDMIYTWRGDLTEFIKYFDQPTRLLVICECIEDKEIAGFIWFDDVVPGFRALANIFFRRKYYGQVSHEASILAKEYAFDGLGIKSLWAFTPWLWAAKHAESIGFEKIVVLPGLYIVDGQLRDAYVLKLNREE